MGPGESLDRLSLVAKSNKLIGIRMINGPDSFNGITKRVSVRVKLIKTKPKETQ